jgi:hypothetical protein
MVVLRARRRRDSDLTPPICDSDQRPDHLAGQTASASKSAPRQIGDRLGVRSCYHPPVLKRVKMLRRLQVGHY